MSRITNRELQGALRVLNRIAGVPVEAITDGKWNIGTYCLDSAYGGHKLVQIISDGGAQRDVTGRGTAREMYDQIFAFREGWVAAERQMKSRMNGTKEGQVNGQH